MSEARIFVVFGSYSAGPLQLPRVPSVGEIVDLHGAPRGVEHTVRWNIIAGHGLHEVTVYLEPWSPKGEGEE